MRKVQHPSRALVLLIYEIDPLRFYGIAIIRIHDGSKEALIGVLENLDDAKTRRDKRIMTVVLIASGSDLGVRSPRLGSNGTPSFHKCNVERSAADNHTSCTRNPVRYISPVGGIWTKHAEIFQSFAFDHPLSTGGLEGYLRQASGFLGSLAAR